jgi:hypothetical protein
MFIVQIFYLSVYASKDASGLNKQQKQRYTEKEKIIKREINSSGHNSKNKRKDYDNDHKDDESIIKLSSNEDPSIPNSRSRDFGNSKNNGSFRKPLKRNRDDERAPRIRSGARSEDDEKIELLMNQKLQVKHLF